jgi:hypothetical protein
MLFLFEEGDIMSGMVFASLFGQGKDFPVPVFYSGTCSETVGILLIRGRRDGPGE